MVIEREKLMTEKQELQQLAQATQLLQQLTLDMRDKGIAPFILALSTTQFLTYIFKSAEFDVEQALELIRAVWEDDDIELALGIKH